MISVRPPRISKMTQAQQKHLKERVGDIWRKHRWPPSPKVKEPPAIAASRKRVQEYDRKVSAVRCKAEGKRNADMESARKRVMEIILFGTPEEALAAVSTFEKYTATK